MLLLKESRKFEPASKVFNQILEFKTEVICILRKLFKTELYEIK